MIGLTNNFLIPMMKCFGKDRAFFSDNAKKIINNSQKFVYLQQIK